MEFSNVFVILEYLREEFPGLHVDHKDDFDLHARRFKVVEEGQTCRLKVAKDYASDIDAGTLRKLLRNKNIANLMRNPELEYVLIYSKGVDRVPFRTK